MASIKRSSISRKNNNKKEIDIFKEFIQNINFIKLVLKSILKLKDIVNVKIIDIESPKTISNN